MSLGMGFGGDSLLRFGSGLGRDHGLGAEGCDRRGRLVGMIMVVMIVRAVMTMVVIVTMVVVPMIVMIMAFVVMIVAIMIARFVVLMLVVVMFLAVVLAMMLRIGMQMLAFVRCALGVRGFALDRLGGGIATCVEAFDDVTTHALALTAAAGVAVARAAAAVGAVLALFLGLAMGLFLGLDQCLPVGDRDLVVVGMDFAEGEEAVAVAAIFDKGGLERGLHPGDLGEVDIPAQLLALGGLEIKLFDAIAADHDDPGLLRVGGIDQHLVGHVLTLGGGGRDSPWARSALPGDATVHLIRG
ncbi:MULTISPECIES: hypothetical protein [Bradyrhizobium]|uniref:hypothetical protein n=1 Tax=Bradyrhizobium sp. Mp27 TaxID=3042157 RepID=UPI00248C8331|nr:MULTISPECIES: hypothetical protein [Bradyrhizobium]MDI2073645.1 hypothetical protein [Bradyrhizobium sp. Mp27]